MNKEDLNNSSKRAFLCECLSSAFVAGDTVKLEFLWPGPAPRAGQFFLIKPRRTTAFLGRPISAAGWKSKVPFAPYENTERRVNIDRRLISHRYMNPNLRLLINRRITTERRQNTGMILSFFIVRRGSGSRDLTDLRPGEEAVLVGPLGNYWAWVDTGLSEENLASPIALIGGGVGIAPLLAYIPELRNRPFDFYAGFRTGSFGLKNIKPRSLVVSTEDGSQGIKGRITDFFTPSGYSMVLACGPEAMLKTAGDACIASEIPCFISMERRMACGVGACLGCTVKTTKGNRRCCADGPIFSAEEVCFDN